MQKLRKRIKYSRGYDIVLKQLDICGLKFCFGTVGIPLIELCNAICAPTNGLQYYSFRNEQQGSYAAGVIGYLTGIPGC